MNYVYFQCEYMKKYALKTKFEVRPFAAFWENMMGTCFWMSHSSLAFFSTDRIEFTSYYYVEHKRKCILNLTSGVFPVNLRVSRGL